MAKAEKLLVIGLDCAPPRLVFEDFRGDMPVVSSLMDAGLYGPMRSCDPPITIPAWTVMTSGKSPGRLGMYGFRNRADHSYDRMIIADASRVREDRVWDILSRRDRGVVLLGVPQTYPPSWVRGCVVADFLAPDTDSNYTFPLPLKNEIRDAVGDYIIDVKNFRNDDKEQLIRSIHKMTDTRFRLARHLMARKPWDFFMMVEMGPDRMHHGLWRHHDPEHRGHDPASPFRNAMRDYYKALDAHIGALLEAVDRSRTAVIVVSDHGARRLEGGVCINEWLIREGYLSLKSKPEGAARIEDCEIDWAKTRAWASGGYYGRLFINVAGREPQGVVPQSGYEALRGELVARIAAIPDPQGRTMNTRVLRPEELYDECRGVPPDLFIYFDDLAWRSVGTVGGGAIHTFENDTGPDDANHDFHGIFILSAPGLAPQGQVPEIKIIDIAPTMLALLGEPAPRDMQGRAISFL